MLAILSYIISKNERENSWKVIAEHLAIALIVVIVTHYIGNLVSERFT